VNLVRREGRDTELRALATRLHASRDAALVGAVSSRRGQSSPQFRDRADELDVVFRGLTSAHGSHFWLVIAPPQMGKTWFLDRVAAEMTMARTPSWAARLVDLSEQPPEIRRDPASLLASLFGLSGQIEIDPRSLRDIAQRISRAARPYLCLLDSAELLDGSTAVVLRSSLSQIYQLVQRAGNKDVRLGLIVASRRDNDWRRISPDPRLSALPLTEFNLEVTRQAILDLAGDMGRQFSSEISSADAAMVYRLTQGLPALQVRCLQWIRAQDWVAIDRLEDEEVYTNLVGGYVDNVLLAQESLFPNVQEEAPLPRLALQHALRVLVPYRLFTQSHLRYHLDADFGLRRVMEDLGWSMEDLWQAISSTALLKRPLHEPWQEIYPAIRRLLYQYFYRTDEARIDANVRARAFVEVWTERQAGKEQAVGLVECLWHEAVALRLSQPEDLAETLTASARALSQIIKSSSAYTHAELREYVGERMRDDQELEGVIGDDDGLYDMLIAVFAASGSEPSDQSRDAM
jgi:hypothetical protein